MAKICDIPYPIYDLTKNLKQTCILISSVVQTKFELP